MEIVINNNGEHISATLEVVDGVMIVSPVNEKDIAQFKDGDIITCGWENEFNACSWVCVLNAPNGKIEKCKDNYFLEEYCGTYLVGGDGKEQTWIDSYSDSATWVRYATEKEKQKLFDALAKEGMAWDAEKKAVVELKREPKIGETCFAPYFDFPKFITTQWLWKINLYSTEYCDKGWCFKTKEECAAFCKKLDEAIEGVKP